MDAMQGRVSAVVFQTVLSELERRKPQQLTDRTERRWYGRWVHAIREKGEDNRPRWSADEIALHLIAPGSCPVADCEDGVLINTDQICSHCQQPEHRFVPGTAAASSDQARNDALIAMRQAVRSSPHRTAAAAPHRTGRSVRPADADSLERALKRVRARLTDPETPRLTQPPTPEEPDATDSIILQARAEREAAEQDPTRTAALARARAERARRPKLGR